SVNRLWCVDRSAAQVVVTPSGFGAWLHGHGQNVEGDAYAVVRWVVMNERVVAAAQVLHEGVPGSNGPCRCQAFEPAHRLQPRLESAVIGFDGVVFVALGDMACRRR